MDVKITAMCLKQSIVGVTQIDLLAVDADVAVVIKQYRAGHERVVTMLIDPFQRTCYFG